MQHGFSSATDLLREPSGEMIFAAAFARTKRVSRFPRHAFLPTNIMPKIYNDTIHSWLTPAYQNRDI
jgi:hypothetical protein